MSLASCEVGHSLAPLAKGVEQPSPREALGQEARIARMCAPGSSSCLSPDDSDNGGAAGGGGAVNWDGSWDGVLLQIPAWTFLLRQVTYTL